MLSSVAQSAQRARDGLEARRNLIDELTSCWNRESFSTQLHPESADLARALLHTRERFLSRPLSAGFAAA